MNKREFLRTSSILAAGVAISPLSSCSSEQSGGAAGGAEKASGAVSEFTLPDLPYAKDALAPNIDAETMGIHHGKHHAGYVRKLNAALEGHSMAGNSLNEIIAAVSEDDTAVRNNGGGHYNHSMFWKVMKPGGGDVPSGELAEAINGSFGDYDTFKEQFSNAAATRFGSGWAWLSKGADGKLFVSSTPNQDNPAMTNIAEQPGSPILGIDVWEHAYYLNYQNRRKEYIGNFFNVINWEAVAANLATLS